MPTYHQLLIDTIETAFDVLTLYLLRYGTVIRMYSFRREVIIDFTFFGRPVSPGAHHACDVDNALTVPFYRVIIVYVARRYDATQPGKVIPPVSHLILHLSLLRLSWSTIHRHHDCAPIRVMTIMMAPPCNASAISDILSDNVFADPHDIKLLLAAMAAAANTLRIPTISSHRFHEDLAL